MKVGLMNTRLLWRALEYSLMRVLRELNLYSFTSGLYSWWANSFWSWLFLYRLSFRLLLHSSFLYWLLYQISLVLVAADSWYLPLLSSFYLLSHILFNFIYIIYFYKCISYFKSLGYFSNFSCSLKYFCLYSGN